MVSSVVIYDLCWSSDLFPHFVFEIFVFRIFCRSLVSSFVSLVCFSFFHNRCLTIVQRTQYKNNSTRYARLDRRLEALSGHQTCTRHIPGIFIQGHPGGIVVALECC